MSITFEFSKQDKLLKQYYVLREECFRKELGLDSFNGSEDGYDKSGNILIVRDGDQCIGGVRITGSSEAGSRLPLEQKGLDLRQALPDLGLEQNAYCQWERLVLKPEYRSTEMLRGICHALIEGCAMLGYHYAFNVTGIKRARLYKRIHSCLGYGYEIYNHIKMPVDKGFAHLEHLLSIASVPKARIRATQPTDYQSLFVSRLDMEQLKNAA